MTTRDELADLIAETYDAHGEGSWDSAASAAAAILARWRLVGRYKCWYKTSHGDFADPNETCCGQPVIHWEEESVR